MNRGAGSKCAGEDAGIVDNGRGRDRGLLALSERNSRSFHSDAATWIPQMGAS
jgi:hypothetical protein